MRVWFFYDTNEDDHSLKPLALFFSEEKAKEFIKQSKVLYHPDTNYSNYFLPRREASYMIIDVAENGNVVVAEEELKDEEIYKLREIWNIYKKGLTRPLKF